MKEFNIKDFQNRPNPSKEGSIIPDTHVFDPKNPQPFRAPAPGPRSGLVPFWSVSSLQNFEACQYKLFLRYVKKILEPGNEFTERGTQIHTLAEHFITGEIDELPEELSKFEKQFHELKADYDKRSVEVEQPWAYDVDWDVTDWKSDQTWLRMKLDAFIRQDATSAVVVDFKTGKKFGNEFKHSFQALVYAIGAFMRYPELEFVKAEFWYLDQAARLDKYWRRGEIARFLPNVNKRAIALTSCTSFKPNPSKSNCGLCYYYKSGDCPYGSLV